MMTGNYREQQARSALELGKNQEVITLLTNDFSLAVEEWRMLGLAYLRSGRHLEAEMPLLHAVALGDAEAKVEYGNVLRLQGLYSKAATHFDSVESSLTGELLWRAWRWWGTAEFQSGSTDAGLQRCERAWYGYLTLGDQDMTGRITQTLAQMYSYVGDFKRAEHLYREAIRLLPITGNVMPRAAALRGLAALQLQAFELDAAEQTLHLASAAVAQIESLSSKAHLLTMQAELYHLRGDQSMYAFVLNELKSVVVDTQDFELLIWTASRLADHHSLRGFHSLALQALTELAPDQQHPTLLATRGILLKRRGHHQAAVHDLLRALETPSMGQHMQVRTRLHLADAYEKLQQGEACVAVMSEVLDTLLTCRDYPSYQPDLLELADLAQYALFDPELAPMMESVLERFGELISISPKSEQAVRLQLTTLGKAEARLDGELVSFSLEGCLLTLVYLALHPSKTRKELEAALYPGKSPETAGSYFRAVFRELRQKLGTETILMVSSGQQPRYLIGPTLHLDLDILHLREAGERGDIARMVALYRGAFMQHLSSDNDWVHTLRSELREDVCYELRVRMSRARHQGDLRRALLLANQVIRIDPYDREVLEERLELARSVASPSEVAQYTVALNQRLN